MARIGLKAARSCARWTACRLRPGRRADRSSCGSDGDRVEHAVDGVAGLVVAVGPEVAVRVEGLDGGLMAEPFLDRLDRAALGRSAGKRRNWRRSWKVAQSGSSALAATRRHTLPKALRWSGSPVRVGEHESVRVRPLPGQLRRQRVDDADRQGTGVRASGRRAPGGTSRAGRPSMAGAAGRPPRLGVGPEERSPAVRVDVDAAGEIASDGVEKPLGVALAPELPRSLRTARVLAPPGPVSTVGPLVDARHNPSLDGSKSPDPVLKKSSGPQKLLSSEDYRALRAGTG